VNSSIEQKNHAAEEKRQLQQQYIHTALHHQLIHHHQVQRRIISHQPERTFTPNLIFWMVDVVGWVLGVEMVMVGLSLYSSETAVFNLS
jgi:hypothetical protein